MRKHRVWIAIIILALFASVASAAFLRKDVKVRRVVPPAHVLANAKQIGVVSFSGPGSSTLNQKFMSMATETYRDGASTITDVGDAGKALTGGILGMGAGILGGKQVGDAVSGAVQGKGAPVLEKGLHTKPFNVRQYNSTDEAKSGGADVIVTCGLRSDGVKSENYEAKGYKIDGNGKKTEYIAHCTKVTTEVFGSMKAVLAANDNVVVNQELSGGATSSACDEKRSSLPSAEALASAAVEDLAPKMANEIFPSLEELGWNLKKDKLTKKAKSLAADGKYQDAINQLRIAIKADSMNYAANYNLGILEEAFGDYENAMKHYKTADSIQPGDDAHDAVLKLEKRIAQVAQLQTLGMTLQPATFKDEGVKIPKMIVKGNNKDRYQLLVEPQEGSTKACDVAGGMELEYVGKGTGWIQIKCFDGSGAGWIKSENVEMKD